jgi:NAD(P)-dependent dehydrogenase (short-subunit alcohol dehydrogenase family)
MKSPMDMTGTRVLITGASSGIGRSTAVLLAELGSQLVLVSRNENRLKEALQNLPGTGHQIYPFDLTKIEHIDAWLRDIVSASGPLCGLVHSAGIHRTVPIRFEKPNVDDPLWRLNFHAATALLTSFRKPGNRTPHASVVFVSSIVGLIGQPGISSYCATKGALISYARSAGLELAREGIRVNCVAPGHVHTNLSALAESRLTEAQVKTIEDSHPLGIGTPEDVANAIAFLLADTGKWITGTTLVVDGGYTAH